MDERARLADLSLPLDRDRFLRQLLRELAGTLEEVVGIDEAEGYIAMVGRHMGRWMDRLYREGLGLPRLDARRVAHVLVDLKARIEGGFAIESLDEGRIVLVNDRCPFGEMVRDRPSLCMMTSNVFGTLASANLGYAKVALEETIARGDDRCRVVVHLRDDEAAARADGREYFGEAP